MTAKQRKFCDEFLISGNATDAAIKAGYSSDSARFIGSENLTKPNIRAYIENRLDEISSERIAAVEEVLEYLTAVMRGESVAKVVVVESVGGGRSVARHIEKHPCELERLKAAELIGKRYGLFTDKVGLDGVIPVVITGDDQLED